MEKKSKRQEHREKMERQRKRSRLMMIGLITLGAIIIVFAFVAPGLKGAGEIITVTPAALPSANGLTLGDPNASVTIDVFEDFQCPACQYFTESVETLIIQNLLSSGDVKYTFHQYPFIDGDGVSNNGESDQAANASMCANEQGKFWEMHSVIFANWNGENKGNLSDIRLVAMAESVGLDMNAFNDCFRARKYKNDIQADFELGQTMGVSGTPSVFVNGTKVGQPGKIASYQEIADAVNLAIGTAQ
jgi:protein-disulfide isomerase